MSEISEIGILTIITVCSSLIIIIIRILMKSKCSNFILCWGCLEIDRDIEKENEIEQIKIEHNIKDDNENLNINEIMTNVKNNNIIK